MRTVEKGGEFAIQMVNEITERTTDANGQEMLFPETEIDMYWTSLGVSDEDVIALYHNHAVCEQYHSAIKRRRIRTVIDNLILIAGHLTDHARKLWLALERSNVWIRTFLRVAESF